MRGLLSTLNKSDDRSPDRHRPLVSRPRLVNLSTTLQALQEHLATYITQSLTASNHYDLLARIPVHDSYGDGYYWVWSKYEIRTYPSLIPSQLIFSEALVYTTNRKISRKICVLSL